MYPTRRGWSGAALAAVLAVLAVVFARPVMLAGAALVGAWLLTQQYRFVRDLERTVESVSISQSPARTAVRTGDEVPVTLTARCAVDTALTLEIRAGLPVAATVTEPLTITLEPDTERTDRTRTVSWPVAGRHSFDEATVTATDGLFRETINAGSSPTITVESPSPPTLHIGEGGDRIATSYGSHEVGRAGSGLTLAELREYVPGDTDNEIDWKATARLATLFVREYEAETDHRTLLVVDHRASLAAGPQAETKLEALREVALVIAGNARQLNDPLGLVTVGDGGITGEIRMASPAVTYAAIRRQLFDLEPTTGDATAETTVSDRDRSTSPATTETASSPPTGLADAITPPVAVSAGEPSDAVRQRRTTPGDAKRSLTDLEGGDDAFARTLRPYYADRQIYRKRIAEGPLYGAVRQGTTGVHGKIRTVICTDDSRPAELRETVSLARQGGNEVMILLAPSVLYEPGGLADIERAYDQYVAFEKFRRELARMDGVTALEVGSADRLSTVLEAGRTRGGRA